MWGGFPGACRPFQGAPGASNGLQRPPGASKDLSQSHSAAEDGLTALCNDPHVAEVLELATPPQMNIRVIWGFIGMMENKMDTTI